MKYPQIVYFHLTIARNYVNYYVHYASGRTICKTVSCYPDKYMLYSMEFLRWSKSIKHFTQQLSIHRIIPKSVHTWILTEHPQASYRDNEYDSSIFSFTLANSDYALTPAEKFNY